MPTHQKYPYKPHKLFWVLTNISHIITQLVLTQILLILLPKLGHKIIQSLKKLKLIYLVGKTQKVQRNSLQSLLLHDTLYKVYCYTTPYYKVRCYMVLYYKACYYTTLYYKAHYYTTLFTKPVATWHSLRSLLLHDTHYKARCYTTPYYKARCYRTLFTKLVVTWHPITKSITTRHSLQNPLLHSTILRNP